MKKLFFALVLLFGIVSNVFANSVVSDYLKNENNQYLQSIIIDQDSKLVYMTYIYDNYGTSNPNNIVKLEKTVEGIVCNDPAYRKAINSGYKILIESIYIKSLSIIKIEIDSCPI